MGWGVRENSQECLNVSSLREAETMAERDRGKSEVMLRLLRKRTLF